MATHRGGHRDPLGDLSRVPRTLEHRHREAVLGPGDRQAAASRCERHRCVDRQRSRVQRQRFDAHLDDARITHYRTPPRSPNHNAVCERFQGTALQECWRPAFHRRRFDRLGQLRAEIDTWLVDYNTRRRITATSWPAEHPAKSSTTPQETSIMTTTTGPICHLDSWPGRSSSLTSHLDVRRGPARPTVRVAAQRLARPDLQHRHPSTHVGQAASCTYVYS